MVGETTIFIHWPLLFGLFHTNIIFFPSVFNLIDLISTIVLSLFLLCGYFGSQAMISPVVRGAIAETVVSQEKKVLNQNIS